MDSQKPSNPGNLLHDLESIRQLLEQNPLEPPLLTESIDPNSIPLLSEIVNPADLPAPLFNLSAPASQPPVAASAATPVPVAKPMAPLPPPPPTTPAPTASPAPSATISEQLQQRLHPAALELNRLDRELRTAAHLMLQDIIDDFVPLIEAELKTRLDAHLNQLLSQRKR
ncbi:MAG: DNA polymerase III subunit chi [Pseudomonas sp.]|uniref:DNA polymerase III subunit chi n=1 Tax=Pseudomonas sp. TaxID=306 RepID=UPI00273732A2|nr:DNA polymerase III subunit chi [Pseudomonas sp.]MDP3846893.1 DNA polymerase III subunit chi [Pseudomonas sp.]